MHELYKARQWWPLKFNQTLADAIRAERSNVVNPNNPHEVILENAQKIREMNTMPGPVEPCVLEGAVVEALVDLWEIRLGVIRGRDA